jgi:hypothetical protein
LGTTATDCVYGKNSSLSVIEVRKPPGASEARHLHRNASIFSSFCPAEP